MVTELIKSSSVIKRDISLLRDKNTSVTAFSQTMHRLSLAMAFYAGEKLSTSEYQVETPLETTEGFRIIKVPVLSPVLRAGLGMLSGFREIFPESPVAMIGTRRNEETLQPENYYVNVPANDVNEPVFILDPMLATGGTVSHALSYIKGLGFREMIYFSIISSPEGIEKIAGDHPEVRLITCVIDRELNNRGYILPGLGDAGDRYFGT
ncbi:MAG: uracil phosphoribosyltransferase [Ignavibacteriaceae bacterium]|nr:uracil phosphoribosyltransferase [Ignavibacteriaceae bacterium]